MTSVSIIVASGGWAGGGKCPPVVTHDDPEAAERLGPEREPE